MTVVNQNEKSLHKDGSQRILSIQDDMNKSNISVGSDNTIHKGSLYYTTQLIRSIT